MVSFWTEPTPVQYCRYRYMHVLSCQKQGSKYNLNKKKEMVCFSPAAITLPDVLKSRSKAHTCATLNNISSTVPKWG